MKNDMSNSTSSLRILALRPLEVPSQSFGAQDPVSLGKGMHRVLKAREIYKFYSGVEIGDKEITIANNTPIDLYEIRQNNGTIGVNISALVGENGSGKSTIIDYIIRVINNLSAVLFGEYYYNSSSEHLHYIQNVYAELFVLIENTIYCIICQGEYINIITYDYNKTDKNKDYYRLKKTKPYKVNTKEPCEEKNERYEVLSKFCYTIIVNYSLYSFDTSSYKSELTDDDKEIKIYKDGIEKRYINKIFEQIRSKAEDTNDKRIYIDAKSWLPGLFQKYDNYQRPISITPNRHNGQVDQRKEYAKGKEKLLSLTLLRDNNNKRFYTHINNKEIIDKITLTLNPVAAKQNYFSVFNGCCPHFSKPVRLALFNLVRNYIINQFSKDKKQELEEGFNCPYRKAAWYYLVSEFFMIVLTYSELDKFKQSLQGIESIITPKTIIDLKRAIDVVCDIHSHITRRFWRALFFLKYDHLLKYDSGVPYRDNPLKVDEISVDYYSEITYELIKNNSEIHYVDELLPPPIYNIDFKLFSKNDKDKNVIPFETLSSGEKQITLSLSTLFYFLTNLDSISDNSSKLTNNENNVNQNNMIIIYEHVCVIFDELELYYHPEMQRSFVNRLLSGLKQLEFKNIKSIQIIMATHSPFILSDVAKTNVLFLDRNGYPQEVDSMHTFGANIHTMLKNSFFLKEGAIGAFAKKVIGEVEACLKIYKLCPENKDDIVVKKLEEIKELITDESGFELSDPYKLLEPFIERNNEGIIEQFHFGEFKSYYSKERIRATIDLFDEPIIKKVLRDDYYEVFPKEKAKEELVVSLERQLTELKNTVQSSKNGDSAFFEDLISQIENKIKKLKYE